jgi:hypothetical protein
MDVLQTIQSGMAKHLKSSTGINYGKANGRKLPFV